MTEQTPPNQHEDITAPSRTLWHRLLGKELELALTPVGITVLTEVQVSSNPPKADILLLRRVTGAWTNEQLPFLPDGIRSSRASHILIEFKYRETLQEETFQQAVGYDYFYLQGQQLMRGQVETFVISAKTPQQATLQAFGYEPTEANGVYRSKQMLIRHITLIILNELALAPYNAFVQCFASQRRVRKAAFQHLLAKEYGTFNTALWGFLTGLETHIQTKEGDVKKSRKLDEGLTPELVMETGWRIRQSLIANLTLQERQSLIATLPVEERSKVLIGLSPEDRQILIASLPADERKALIAGLPADERKALIASLPADERKLLVTDLPLEDRLAGLPAEDVDALLAQIEAYLRRPDRAPK